MLVASRPLRTLATWRGTRRGSRPETWRIVRSRTQTSTCCFTVPGKSRGNAWTCPWYDMSSWGGPLGLARALISSRWLHTDKTQIPNAKVPLPTSTWVFLPGRIFRSRRYYRQTTSPKLQARGQRSSGRRERERERMGQSRRMQMAGRDIRVFGGMVKVVDRCHSLL